MPRGINRQQRCKPGPGDTTRTGGGKIPPVQDETFTLRDLPETHAAMTLSYLLHENVVDLVGQKALTNA